MLLAVAGCCLLCVVFVVVWCCLLNVGCCLWFAVLFVVSRFCSSSVGGNVLMSVV